MKAWTLAMCAVLVPLSLWAAPANPEGAPGVSLGRLAGSYQLGDGLGFNFQLTLTLEGTFSYQWMGCMGLYAEASGKALLSGGELVLEPTVLKGQSAREFRSRFRPVFWGDRIYLVPPREIPFFVRQIRKGREPRTSSFGEVYLREEDWEKPVTVLPNLPELESPRRP